jgi:outer membrane protein assembly factor BamB
MSTRPRILLAIIALALATSAQAADWPQWRGPFRQGKSAETNLLRSWPVGGPPLVWHAQDIGHGYSTPAVVGDRLYLISNKGLENEYVQALSTTDGQELWQTRIGNVGKNTGPQYPGSRSTPTVDGDHLYALGSDGDLACLETATGKLVWTKNLRTAFGGKPGAWAYAESPLIDGDVLVATPGGSQATLVALRKQTGDLIWKTALPEGDEAGYASAIVFELDGIKQYIQFLAKGLVGVDAKTGQLLWRYAKTAEGSAANIPTPIVRGSAIYSAAGRTGGGLVKLDVADGKVQTEPVYFTAKLPTSIGGAVEVDGFLYGTNRQGLMCADFETGESKWQDRCVGPASVCYVDGLLYVHGENGDVALVEPSPQEYRERGRFTPPNQPERGNSQAWAYPVVANGRLYIRDLGSLWSFDISAQ